MKKRMESDLLLKIISVVFAFLLWMFVINTDNPVIKKTFSDVPVDMLNEQVLDDLNQTYKIESGDTVSFTVKGKKDVVDRLTKSDFRATADVSSMSDVHAIQIEVEALRYKSQLDIDTGGATVKVVLEDVKSDQIPVNVVVKGIPAIGYTVSTQTATPNLISVSGPKSVVSRIKQIVAKVDVSGLKKDVTMAQNVKCYDEDGDEVSQDRIKLDTTKIKVKIGLSRTKTIPFTVETKGTPGKGYVLGSIDYEPKHIEITGAEDDLEKISSIKLANLDISDSTKSIEKTIKASDIKLPDGITFVKSVDFSLCQMLFEPVPLHSHLISVVEIFLIFCISCGNILREHSPCGIDHQRDRQPVKNAKTAEHRQKKQYQCSNALCLCQFIRPISSNHKTLYFLPHCSDLLSSDFMLRFKGNRVNTPIVF